MRYGGGLEVDDEKLDLVRELDGVKNAAPFIYSEMMVRSRFSAEGVVFKGVDPTLTGDVTEIRAQISLGVDGVTETDDARRAVFAALADPVPGRTEEDEPMPGMLLGDALMESLQVLPGEQIQLINPVGSAKGFLGMPMPTAKNFRVLGAFHSGMFEYDTKWAYVSIADAQDFLKQEGEVTGIEIRVDDIDHVESLSRALEDELGYPHYARHWKNLNQGLFEALALEKIVMSAILGMIIVVAGLLIVSNLYMMVLTKRREIAILKAMGASSWSIMRVFVMIGGAIGLVGTSLGSVLGYAGCHFLAWYEWPLETDVYYLSSLPVVMETENFVAVAGLALMTCLLSTLYPALRASMLDPVEGLRYE
jgi:lipoprotein-releasing system permease protein